MDNPLEQPAPEDPIARVHAFARDLAWGVAHGKWGTGFGVMRSAGEETLHVLRGPIEHFGKYRREKWEDNPPSCEMLQTFGYLGLGIETTSRGNPTFLLTEKAFALLDKPAVPPKIFISYKQSESSAFAMLVEARLTHANPELGIFIDKSIRGGERWANRIQQAIKNCDYFICIFGPETPESEGVRKELDLALECNKHILLLTHRGYKMLPDGLSEIHRCAEILKENADGYEIAILRLFRDMGYPTLQSPRPSAAAAN